MRFFPAWSCLTLCWLATVPFAQLAEPFGSGLRWRHDPPAGTPWIPRDVALVGSGEYVWAAPTVANPRLALFAASSSQALSGPLFEDADLAEAIGIVRVAAGDRISELFALVQLPDPDAANRRTLVTCYDALARGVPFAPVWTHDFGRVVNAPGRLAATPDGATLVAALFDDGAGEIVLDELDPASGARLSRVTLPARALRALALSADGKRVALSAGERLRVLELASGQTLLDVPAFSSTEALALSATGERVLWADLDRFLLHVEENGVWSLEGEYSAGIELAVTAACDARGQVLALGFWNPVDGNTVRFRFVDATSSVVLSEHVQSGAATGLQNFPSDVVMTADGRRAALGFWGAADARPEVLLVDPLEDLPLLQVDLPGSTYALALDPAGTRVAVAAKQGHANLFSSLGSIELHVTGERDLELLQPVRIGAALRVAASVPGAQAFWFALGFRAQVPGLFGGRPLWLDTSGPITLRAAPADASGRADLDLPMPADPTLIGLPIVVQAASYGALGLRLTEHASFPEIL